MGYTKRAIKGVSWMSIFRVVTRILSFLRIAVLARVLTPSQFGVFGIAALVLSLLEVFTETGINIFLIQKKDQANGYISSAWFVSIIRGSLIYLILILSAPFIVNFFNSPDSYKVLILIAIVPLVRGFINPSIINIQKDIQFHKEFYLRSVLLVVDASVAIISAFITKSAESFAYGLIASAVIEVILSFILFKPLPKLSFELDKIKHIIGRGWWITLTGIFSYFADNGDNVTVGRILGISSLGLYQVAYKISTLTISEVVEVVNKVTFPVYSKFADDRRRLFRAFLKVSSLSSMIAMLVGVIIFIFAKQIVLIIAGANWLTVVPVVQVLAIYGIIRTVFANFSVLFLSLDKQDYVAKMTFCRVSALAIAIIPFVNSYGLMGAAYAMIFSILVEIPVILYFTYRFFGKSIFKLSVA